MNLRTILWLVGIVLGVVGLAQIPCIVLAIALGEPWGPFSLVLGFGLSPWVLLLRMGRKGLSLDHRSALLSVTLCWLGACGCLQRAEDGVETVAASTYERLIVSAVKVA